MEIWKDVVGAEEYYQISNHGNIKNKLTGKVLNPSNSGRYLHITLRYGINKEKLIHRLVAEAFLPNPDNLPQVNHKDENTKNNHVDNLEWCTCQYNVTYGKCTAVKSHPVIQSKTDGEVVKIWDSLKSASTALGVKYQCISNCCRGIRKTCGGYCWDYYTGEMNDKFTNDANN